MVELILPQPMVRVAKRVARRVVRRTVKCILAVVSKCEVFDLVEVVFV